VAYIIFLLINCQGEKVLTASIRRDISQNIFAKFLFFERRFGRGGLPPCGLKTPQGSHNFNERIPPIRRRLPKLDKVVNENLEDTGGILLLTFKANVTILAARKNNFS
jgi:hypothetical protein